MLQYKLGKLFFAFIKIVKGRYMKIKDQLNLFLLKTDELLSSKYILAEIKIVGVLKAIASSKTIMDIVRGSLKNFDVESAKAKYLARSDYDESRGQFVMPENSGDMIALTFSLLMAIDSKEIALSDLLREYFYADGSLFASYNEFLSKVIKPFRNTVKVFTEGIMDGKISVCEPSKKTTETVIENSNDKQSVLASVNLLKDNRAFVITCKLDREVIEDAITVLDALMVAIDNADKKRVKELLIAYKYLDKNYKKLKFDYEKLLENLKLGKVL